MTAHSEEKKPFAGLHLNVAQARVDWCLRVRVRARLVRGSWPALPARRFHCLLRGKSHARPSRDGIAQHTRRRSVVLRARQLLCPVQYKDIRAISRPLGCLRFSRWTVLLRLLTNHLWETPGTRTNRDSSSLALVVVDHSPPSIRPSTLPPLTHNLNSINLLRAVEQTKLYLLARATSQEPCPWTTQTFDWRPRHWRI